MAEKFSQNLFQSNGNASHSVINTLIDNKSDVSDIEASKAY